MIQKFGLLILSLIFIQGANAGESPMEVVTTLADLAEVAKQVGGDSVNVKSLLTGAEDPHFVDAVPQYIVQVASSDLVVAVGLSLEIGWLPQVLERSGNIRVQKGAPGYLEVGAQIQVLGKLQEPVDRSMGHVHPEGNPHFYLAPSRLIEAARVIQAKLTELRPKKAAEFEANVQKFSKKMKSIQEKGIKRIRQALNQHQPSKGDADSKLKVIQYHEELDYFFKDYQIQSQGSIEHTPGVPPSMGQIIAASKQARAEKIKLAIQMDHHPTNVMKRFETLSQVKSISVPGGVKLTDPKLSSLEGVQERLVSRIIQGLQ